MRQLVAGALRSAAGAAAARLRQPRRPEARFEQRLEEALDARTDPVVVLVGDTAATTAASKVVEHAGFPLHRMSLQSEPDLDLRLAALGGADVLVVECADSPDRTGLVARLVHHVTARGVMFVPEVGQGSVAALLRGWSDLPTTVDADERRRDGRPGNGGGRPDHAVTVERTVEWFPTHAEVTLRTRPFLKLREEQTNTYLSLAGPRAGRVLETLDAVRWTSQATVRQAGVPPRPLPEHYDVPQLSLREYHDVHCSPGQVALQGSVVLPDSFRHNQRRTLGNKQLLTVAEPFVVPRNAASPSPLPGTFFYLDSSFRGHFGHAMTEQLSRFWGWPRAKEMFPELKVLLLEEKRKDLYPFEVELYSAAGVPADDIVLVPGPVAVDRLVAATPMFSQPEYVHPGLGQVYARVSDALSARASEAARPTHVFCSRRHDKRACHNTEEVERLFIDHGFSVVFPEDYSLADQAQLFREAEVIAGFAGSAMFNLLFCAAPKKVVMLASENYWAQNEYMIASVLGHELTVAWCRPDFPKQPGSGFDQKVFQSPFTFDPDREGRLVLEALQAL